MTLAFYESLSAVAVSGKRTTNTITLASPHDNGALQELEESEYWLELLGESGFIPEERLAAVKKETGELKGIFVSIFRTTKAKSKAFKP